MSKAYTLSQLISTGTQNSGGVTSFDSRTGAITLTASANTCVEAGSIMHAINATATDPSPAGSLHISATGVAIPALA